jgi:menaquinol-cytochrome c reductase iron-sulfur subunit
MDEFQNLDAPVKKLVTIEQRDGWRRTIAEKPVYVSKDAKGELVVLSAVCTHLGCTVPWVEKEKKFICPCHLGAFSPEGKLLGGPPPRDMDRLETKVEDGVLKTQYQFFRQLTRNKEELA